MKAKNERFNVSYYSDRLAAHGVSHLSLNWGRKNSQTLRFKVLSQIADIKFKRVLDVGCGLGDFWAWSQAQKMRLKYTGIDITPAMIEKSRLRFPEVDFHTGSILKEEVISTKFDYVFASGIFTYYLHNSADFVWKMVRKMYEICLKGVAFNMLSAWADTRDPDEFYGDPSEILKICGKITQRVVLRHDYHPGDFTVYLYKNGQDRFN